MKILPIQELKPLGMCEFPVAPHSGADTRLREAKPPDKGGGRFPSLQHRPVAPHAPRRYPRGALRTIPPRGGSACPRHPPVSGACPVSGAAPQRLCAPRTRRAHPPGSAHSRKAGAVPHGVEGGPASQAAHQAAAADLRSPPQRDTRGHERPVRALGRFCGRPSGGAGLSRLDMISARGQSPNDDLQTEE